MSIDTKELVGFLKKKLLLAVCMAISLVLLITIYLRSGLSDEQQALLNAKSTEGKRYHSNLVNSLQLTEELQAVVEANRIVKDRAINPADLALNLQYFYRIESETGVNYTDLRQVGVKTSAKDKRVYVPINYTISAHGDFPKMINFLRNLEQGGHFYRLTGLVVSGKGSDMELTLNADLLGRP